MKTFGRMLYRATCQDPTSLSNRLRGDRRTMSARSRNTGNQIRLDSGKVRIGSWLVTRKRIDITSAASLSLAQPMIQGPSMRIRLAGRCVRLTASSPVSGMSKGVPSTQCSPTPKGRSRVRTFRRSTPSGEKGVSRGLGAPPRDGDARRTIRSRPQWHDRRS